MKILKIFGIVVGIHVLLLVLVFAIPGCSSSVKPAPTAADTAPKPAAPAPTISVPLPASSDTAAATPTVIAFDPDAPAAAAPAAATESDVRFVPTRPDTPAAGTLVAQPVEGVTPATSYTVKSGDNLWTIAKKNNLTVAQLTAANSLAANASLRPGQKLIIPSKAIAPAAPAKAAEPAPKANGAKTAEVMKHTVKSGEVLGGIARMYGVRQGDIAVANNISDPAKIRPGMELIIPGWEPSKGTKAGRTSTKSGGAATAPEAKAPAASPVAPAVEITPATPPPAPITVPVIRIEEGTPGSTPSR